MCPPGYYQSANGLMLTQAVGHMIIGTSTAHHMSKLMKYHELIGRLVITGRSFALKFSPIFPDLISMRVISSRVR